MHEPELFLDVSRLVWRRWTGRLPTGIDRVCLAYLDHYSQRALAMVQRGSFRFLFKRQASRDLFSLLARPPRDFRRRLTALLTRSILFERCEPSEGAIYLNVGHTGLNAPGLQDWLMDNHLKPVYMVHDLIPITHPQFCREGEDVRHRHRMQTALKSAEGLIANSQATLDATARFASAEGLDLPASVVAWLGCELPAKPTPPDNGKRPYFLSIGTLEGRKNHLMLLRLWQQLVEDRGEQAPDLVLVGQRGWKADELFSILDRDEDLSDHVHELSHCDDGQLVGLIDEAIALLMPSKAEGFGIPVIETLARGTPVIASDLAVYRELVDGLPTYVDADDATEWKAAIVEALDGVGKARDPRLKGYRAPTWDQHFAKVDPFLAAL